MQYQLEPCIATPHLQPLNADEITSSLMILFHLSGGTKHTIYTHKPSSHS